MNKSSFYVRNDDKRYIDYSLWTVRNPGGEPGLQHHLYPTTFSSHIPFQVSIYHVKADIFYQLIILFIFQCFPLLSLSLDPGLTCSPRPSKTFSPSVVACWGFTLSPTGHGCKWLLKLNTWKIWQDICSIYTFFFISFFVRPLVGSELIWDSAEHTTLAGGFMKHQDLWSFPEIKIKISLCTCRIVQFEITQPRAAHMRNTKETPRGKLAWSNEMS